MIAALGAVTFPLDSDLQPCGSRYFQICLVYGIWPSFETRVAPTYFSDPKLYERDRPLFRQFIPVLRRINYAGWEPLTLANASDMTTTAARFSVERFGRVADGSGVFWTLRRAEPLSVVAPSGPRPVRLTLHAAALGLAPRVEGYAVAEIAQPHSAAMKPVVVAKGATTVDVHVANLPHNTTLVIELTAS